MGRLHDAFRRSAITASAPAASYWDGDLGFESEGGSYSRHVLLGVVIEAVLESGPVHGLRVERTL